MRFQCHHFRQQYKCLRSYVWLAARSLGLNANISLIFLILSTPAIIRNHWYYHIIWSPGSFHSATGNLLNELLRAEDLCKKPFIAKLGNKTVTRTSEALDVDVCKSFQFIRVQCVKGIRCRYIHARLHTRVAG